MAIFSVEQIALAIASNPSGRHEIQWSSQTKSHSWQSEVDSNHVERLLNLDCPAFIHDTKANAIDDDYWGLWERPSTEMTLCRNVYQQREAQAWIPCKIRWWIWRSRNITKLIKTDLRQEGTSTVPYIGTFTLKGTRVSFKASLKSTQRCYCNRKTNREGAVCCTRRR